MVIDFNYWGESNYFGYIVNFSDTELDELLGGDKYFYDNSFEQNICEGNYYDVVIHYLNKDYIKIADNAFDYTIENLQLAKLAFDRADINYYQRLISCDRKLEKLVIKQVENISYDNIKKIVAHVLIDNDVNVNLDCMARLHAFRWAYKQLGELAFSTITHFCSVIKNEVHSDTSESIQARRSIIENSSDPETIFKRLCDATRSNKYSFVPEISYKFTSFSDMILFVLLEMIKNNCKVKICPNCGRYFVPQNRSDELYCRNISPQDEFKTCQEYGKYMTYLEKSRTDEATKLYKQIYNAKANKVKRTGNDVLKADLNAFRERAKIWRTDIKSGAASENDYIAWLKSVKAGDSDNGEH